MKVPNIDVQKKHIMETLEDYKMFLAQCNYMLDPDQSEIEFKSKYVELWNAAFKVLKDWEINLLIYDQFVDDKTSVKRDTLHLSKNTYCRYLVGIRKKIRDELGVKAKANSDNLLKGKEKRNVD